MRRQPGNPVRSCAGSGAAYPGVRGPASGDCQRPALQYFEENSKGTLAPGRRADLVILDQDPMTAPPERLREIQVLSTIKGGKTIYEA